jgi:hypothetical protein
MRVIELEISRFPRKELPYMPGSQTTQGRLDTCAGVSDCVAFRETYPVGTLNKITFAAQWLAYTLPCRRFADILADACARLGANVDRYSFTATDSHRLLLAGLPAHKSLIQLDRQFVAGLTLYATAMPTPGHADLVPIHTR